ncbi:hypothetical protein Tco_0528243 [Tanacetum coccineum]
MKVEESLNVTFDETPPPPKTPPLEDDELVEEEAIEVSKTKPIGNDLEDISLENNQMANIKESKSHPLENVIDIWSNSLLNPQFHVFPLVPPIKCNLSSKLNISKTDDQASSDKTSSNSDMEGVVIFIEFSCNS